MLPSLVRSRSWATAAKSSTDSFTRNILLTNVPRTATPSDIRKQINKAGVTGVSEISLDYDYFKPTGRAFLTLVSSDYLEKSLKALKNLTISGISVDSNYYDSPVQKPGKDWNHQNRVRKAREGELLGRGPNAGILRAEHQQVLTVAGLPARTSVEDLAHILKDFDIKITSKGEPEIVKIPLPPGAISLKSRFLVTVSSQTEAHRLVRKMHASFLKMYGEDNQITAKMIV